PADTEHRTRAITRRYRRRCRHAWKSASVAASRINKRPTLTAALPVAPAPSWAASPHGGFVVRPCDRVRRGQPRRRPDSVTPPPARRVLDGTDHRGQREREILGARVRCRVILLLLHGG